MPQSPREKELLNVASGASLRASLIARAGRRNRNANVVDQMAATTDVSTDKLEPVMCLSPRRRGGECQQDKVLNDLQVRMSTISDHNNESKKAFRLLRTSLDAQKQMRNSASLNPEHVAKL